MTPSLTEGFFLKMVINREMGAYLDFDASRYNDRSEGKGMNADGCDEDGRYIGVNHRRPRCRRVRRAAGGR